MYRRWWTTQLCGDYFINHEIRIPELKNQDFMKSKARVFLPFWCLNTVFFASTRSISGPLFNKIHCIFKSWEFFRPQMSKNAWHLPGWLEGLQERRRTCGELQKVFGPEMDSDCKIGYHGCYYVFLHGGQNILMAINTIAEYLGTFYII